MAKKPEKSSVKSKVLHSAAKFFLQQGYHESTLRQIAEDAKVNYGSLIFAFKNKEQILVELVSFVLEGQFEATSKLLKDLTNDKILFYATETCLQLYMAESSEHMREMYNVSYSLPHSANVIFNTITNKLEYIFNEYLPHLETKDFYELEIASAGIMRNFLSVPCSIYFTMERKIKRFLETTFLVYRIPDQKIDEAIKFVSKFDFKTIAEEVISNLLEYLEERI